MEGEFPHAEFKTLMSLYRTDLNAPVTPVMAATRTGLQEPQAVIALKNISQKCPALGNFYDDSSVFVFRQRHRCQEVLGGADPVISKKPR